MSRKIAYRNLPQLFLMAREKLLRHFRPIISHFGLTEQQWRILRMLSEMKQLEPREISKLCHILNPSLSGVLSRMEEMGLVSRNRVPKDERRVIVQLTPKSEQLVSELSPLIVTQYKLLEEAFGSASLKQLYEVMDQVIGMDLGPMPCVDLPPKKDWANM